MLGDVRISGRARPHSSGDPGGFVGVEKQLHADHFPQPEAVGGSLDSGAVTADGFGDFCNGDVSHATTYSSGRCVRQAIAPEFCHFFCDRARTVDWSLIDQDSAPPGVDASKGKWLAARPGW